MQEPLQLYQSYWPKCKHESMILAKQNQPGQATIHSFYFRLALHLAAFTLFCSISDSSRQDLDHLAREVHRVSPQRSPVCPAERSCATPAGCSARSPPRRRLSLFPAPPQGSSGMWHLFPQQCQLLTFLLHWLCPRNGSALPQLYLLSRTESAGEPSLQAPWSLQPCERPVVFLMKLPYSFI